MNPETAKLLREGFKYIAKSPFGIAFGASAAAGAVAGTTSGSPAVGFNTFSGGFSGAALGYLKGGNRGALIGGIAGGAAGGSIGYGLSKLSSSGTGLGMAASVGGTAIMASLASSMGMAASIKGGLAHGSILKPLGRIIHEGGFASSIDEGAVLAGEKMFKPFIGHNPATDPRGFGANFSDMFYSGVAANKALGKVNKFSSCLERVNGFMQKHPTVTRMVDATVGSPSMLKLSQKLNGLSGASNAELAKVVGKDVVEGLPLGLAGGAIGLGVKSLKGGNKE